MADAAESFQRILKQFSEVSPCSKISITRGKKARVKAPCTARVLFPVAANAVQPRLEMLKRISLAFHSQKQSFCA